jgi:hypothetical protein
MTTLAITGGNTVTMTITAEPHSAVAGRIEALDLEPIVYTLTHPGDGEPAMTLAEADEAVRSYRAFLSLLAAYPDRQLVPTKVIDAVWHAHLLDTSKYATDCQQLFGRFVHHFPYFGLRGADDAAALQAAGADTRRLLGELLGTDVAAAVAPVVCSPFTKCTPGPNQKCSGKCDNHDAKASIRPQPDRTAAAAASSSGRDTPGTIWRPNAPPCSLYARPALANSLARAVMTPTAARASST